MNCLRFAGGERSPFNVKGWTFADMIDDAGFERLLVAAEREFAHLCDAEGAVEFDSPAHLVEVG